ncbi:MAG: pantoate--beta-alanine ligase [Victivallales bacterium]|nr:pantoate--beta-alanine ligase [Victivallales bacterium]
MKIIRDPQETQQLGLLWNSQGLKVGLVPTMGYLHDGHLSLIDEAKKRCDRVFVSIFVNPTQFGPTEDLDRYPRDFARDEALCEEHGVDAVFYPTPESMYAPDFSTWVNEDSLSQTLCGASRPVHFRGVTTVVTKLFNITQCRLAVFGKKDAQQALIICRMVRDLNLPVEIVMAPLVREADGLALSSRNKFLSADEHQRALALSRAVREVERLYGAGERSAEKLLAAARAILEPSGGRIDYVEMMARDNLRPLATLDRPALFALAVFFGQTRLIDNCFLG